MLVQPAARASLAGQVLSCLAAEHEEVKDVAKEVAGRLKELHPEAMPQV